MPPFPNNAMMRYRLARRRPGRKRPSLRYSAELEGREELDEAGRGGRGEVAVAKSRVATSSLLLAGVPQAEQKRPVAGISVPQDEQGGMNFPDTVYRVRPKYLPLTIFCGHR
jgi:hypothetical protein